MEDCIKRAYHLQARTGEHGGAALEYIIVSTFAAIASVAALAFVSKVFNEKIHTMAEKLGVSADGVNVAPF